MHETQGHLPPTPLNAIASRQQPDNYPYRTYVRKGLIPWNIDHPDYNPINFDEPRSRQGDIVDPADPGLINWNTRTSFTGGIELNIKGRPINPAGRTGIEGRGKLNSWGPTLAADPVITRTNPDGQIEALLVVRADNGKIAFPGGKLDFEESTHEYEDERHAATREAYEETGFRVDMSSARVIYRGYVDDERNTDNAWMETVALHIHVDYEESELQPLEAQEDDAEQPAWVVVSPGVIDRLNGGTGYILEEAVKEVK